MKGLLPLIMILALCSGCATTGQIGSYCGPLPGIEAVDLITGDAAQWLTDTYPPGHTTLHLLPAAQAENSFAQAFENKLRARGFTLTALEQPGDLAVAYTFDELTGEMAYYLQLRLSDGFSLSRSYSALGQPEAGRARTPNRD